MIINYKIPRENLMRQMEELK